MGKCYYVVTCCIGNVVDIASLALYFEFKKLDQSEIKILIENYTEVLIRKLILYWEFKIMNHAEKFVREFMVLHRNEISLENKIMKAKHFC